MKNRQYIQQRLDIIKKACPFCGHDRAFLKNKGTECTRCKNLNKGTIQVKNKHGKYIIKLVI